MERRVFGLNGVVELVNLIEGDFVWVIVVFGGFFLEVVGEEVVVVVLLLVYIGWSGIEFVVDVGDFRVFFYFEIFN